MDKSLFAAPRRGLRQEDCQFYHTMDIPTVGVVYGFEGGNWDLRPQIKFFLDGLGLAGKRVLEIGPASGHLTFELEKRGADVVAIEIPHDHRYDVVPYPSIAGYWQTAVENTWKPMTNSWWFAHEHFKSRASVVYIGAYDLDKIDIGRFDIALVSNMLLHNRDPLKILQNCAAITDRQVAVVDIVEPSLEALGEPVVRFKPNPNPEPGKEDWNQWWRLSSRFIADSLSVMGFKNASITKFSPEWNKIPIESFRVLASK